ncbi:HNH endonuclease [Pseudomonas nitroreducens]|uniref:HNH endonuclease n=1 Tax=Pseudomonas nitroreducens TaxID=46680 RepID=A0ABS0KNA6_PSENT|nr:HNH endonuclease [Pseudomonas nitroreducens]MBG6289478.1 HNH endonuclease [Pseudomonas nitroreducens]
MSTAIAERQAELRRLLSYCPETGEFRWNVKPPGKVQIGDLAGTKDETFTYIRFEGKRQKAHRLAFLYMTGEIPSGCIDHIDGDPTNNAWANLRICSHSENMQNRKVSKRNKSGFLGVSKHPSGWQATIAKDKKYYHLGLFKTPEEAHEAYLAAKARLHTFNPIPREGSAICKPL